MYFVPFLKVIALKLDIFCSVIAEERNFKLNDNEVFSYTNEMIKAGYIVIIAEM